MGKEIENTVNGNKIQVTHIKIINNRLQGLKKHNIKAIFVFDNLQKCSNLKKATIDKRKKEKDKMKKKYYSTTDECEKKKYYNSIKSITSNEYSDIKKLIKLYGFSYIIAKEEADSQCAYLSKNKLVDYIVSDDSDLLLFGSKNIIKNFTISDKKNMKIIYLHKILKTLKLTQNQFIQLGILLGCDYTNTVKGIGMNKAFKYISEYKSILNMKKNNIVPQLYKFEDALNYFKKSIHKKVTKKDIENKNVDFNKLKKFLLTKGM